MHKAVNRLIAAIEKKERIGIWGDFDVDGQTATIVLVSGLQQVGADVQYHIPIRATESHGISLPALQQFMATGIQLLVTCDTGISAVKPIQYALEQGIKTIITDHHELPDLLPPAVAIINPHMLSATHPASSLSGVGAAFELIQAIYQQLPSPSDPNQFLDLLALGLVADLADMTGDTRYFSHMGILALRNSSRSAIQALLQSAEIDPTFLSEEHISFGLAPRLNAIGRLDDANPMIQLLMTSDESFISQQISKIEALNEQRKLLSGLVFEAAFAQAERSKSLVTDPILLLAHAEWPSSVLGIAASRMVEKTGKPSILLNSSADGLMRGSARSIEGININNLLKETSDLLVSFGGHAMAAGLSLPTENLDLFKKRIFQSAERLLIDQTTPKLPICAYLDLSRITLVDASALEKLSPHGPKNPAPVFATQNVTVKEKLTIGKEKEHAILKIKDNYGEIFDVLYWQGASEPFPDGLFDLAFHIRQSNFRGNLKIQFEYVDFREISSPVLSIADDYTYRLVDVRHEQDLDTVLLSIPKDSEIGVWAEGITSVNPATQDRIHLKPCNTLIIWSVPPSNDILHHVLNKCKPQTIYLGGITPKPASINDLLRSLLGIIKYSINHNDLDNFVSRAATKLATSEAAILKGLDFLTHSGKITPFENDLLAKNNLVSDINRNPFAVKLELEGILDEISAYRAFYLRADIESILS